MVKLSSVLFLVFSFFYTSGQNLKGGVALRIITPDPLLPVSGGVGKPKEAIQKKGDLFVRAMVLQYGTEKVAFVSIDNLGWPSQLGDKSRKLVKGIKPENILIGATHTHSAPDAYAFPDETGKSYANMEYLDWCVTQIADAINEAESKMEEVDLKLGYGEVVKGIAYNYYAPDLYDPNCGLIQLISKKNGKPISTLVNFAIHPEVIGNKQGILTPDMCGPLYDSIEKGGGGMALFFNGAQGGMVTADTRKPGGENNDWEECLRIGNLLGSEVLRIASTSKVVEKPSLSVKSWTVKFPVESPMMHYILKNSPMGYTLTEGNKVSTVQSLVQLGPAKILTIPGEALPNIGYYLKRKMETPFPFLFGLTNDALGYILSKEDFNSFKRYEYISRTSLGEHTGEILVDESIKNFKNY